MIIGLNVGSNASQKNGRGWVNPHTLEFRYIPIEEKKAFDGALITYRKIGLDAISYPDLPVHHDPEFETHTYGHIKRGFGDNKLWEFSADDLLFFYATLDVLPEKKNWGIFIIGYFLVDYVVDTRNMENDQIKALSAFSNNAHLKRVNPGVHLLVKGKPRSSLYTQAIPMSNLENNQRLTTQLENLLTTTSGKKIESGRGLHRWVYYSNSTYFRDLLLNNP